ncbi:MAG: hypothetical protein ABH833_02805 [Parcubacteria group bacterium]
MIFHFIVYLFIGFQFVNVNAEGPREVFGMKVKIPPGEIPVSRGVLERLFPKNFGSVEARQNTWLSATGELAGEQESGGYKLLGVIGLGGGDVELIGKLSRYRAKGPEHLIRLLQTVISDKRCAQDAMVSFALEGEGILDIAPDRITSRHNLGS